MSSNGARAEQPPEEWEAHADVVKFVQEHHIREALVSSLERDKELHRAVALHARKSGEREIANLDDHATIMRSLGRIESALEKQGHALETQGARLDGAVIHLHGADGELAFLGRKSVEHEKAERELRNSIAGVAAQAAEERARMVERASQLERRVVELSGAVGDAAKDGAVAKFVAREAFESIHDENDEAAEERKAKRETKRDCRKLIAWFVLALALAGAGTALRVRYGAENVPQFPAAPAAAH